MATMKKRKKGYRNEKYGNKKKGINHTEESPKDPSMREQQVVALASGTGGPANSVKEPTRRVTKKNLHAWMQEGMTIPQIEAKFYITEPMILNCLSKEASKNFKNKLLKGFAQNEKRAKLPKRKPKAITSSITEEERKDILGQSEIDNGSLNAGTDNPTAEITNTEEGPSGTLQDLKKTAKKISDDIRQDEIKYEEVVAKRRELTSRLLGLQEELNELSQRIDSIVSDTESVSREWASLGEEMQHITERKKRKEAWLKEKKNQIYELSEITIAAGVSNGCFEITAEQAGEEYPVCDEGHEAIYAQLKKQEEEAIQDLTFGQAKDLARLIAVIGNLPDRNNYSVILEGKLERVFHVLEIEKYIIK